MGIIRVSGKIDRAEVERLISRKSLRDEPALGIVRQIVDEVRRRGDEAVIQYTKEFDGVELSPADLEVSEDEIEVAYQGIPEEFVAALSLARDNIKSFSQGQKVVPWTASKENGVSLGERVLPLSRVGVYIPGGRAAYPSSVLMNVVPAKVAGVEEIIMCVPPGEDGRVNRHTLVAAQIAEVDRIFRIGGAQAVAAMAYGTQTIPRVDKITGPGNIYVTLAKKEVYGDVGIDMLAGPSEVLILGDGTADADFVVADMLAQAEHDPKALAILVTDSTELAESAEKRVKVENVRIILVANMASAIEVANIVGPEHLEIMTENPAEMVDEIMNVGTIFIGPYSPVAVGDYLAGPNHVLPTGGTARFSSPLGVYDFVKRSSLVYYTPKGLARASQAIQVLARAEGLVGHARSVGIRVKKSE
ncbi:MAG: histidinol dehydrogenase [Actinomycetota bacterium]